MYNMSEKLRESVLSHVSHPDYHPVKPAVIAKKLGIAGDAMQELKMTIKRMVKAGDLAWGPSHLVYPAAKVQTTQKAEAKRTAKLETAVERSVERKKDKAKKTPARDSKHFTGTFRRAAGGFGFVRPEGTQCAEGRDADVFIPADKCGDAANGDTVSVRLESKRGRMGKQEGRIIDVVERATNRFVGVYFEQAGMGMVQIDGKIFGNAIFVGDPGTKACGRMTKSSSRWSASPRTFTTARASSSKCSAAAANRVSTRCRSSTNSTYRASSMNTSSKTHASKLSCSTSRSRAAATI